MRKFLSLFLIMASVLMSVSLPSWAAPVSTTTAPVKGHAPVVAGVTLTGPATPLAGDTLRLGATFSDPDGDAESGSLMQWYNSDGTAIAGATGQDYVIQDGDVGKRLQAGYTPKTDPLITDPDTGAEVKSALTVLIMGKPDGAKSTFTQDKTLIAATGSDKAILTLTLKDSAGSPVSGIAGRLSLAHVPVNGADTVSLTTDDRGNGVYDFLVTGTEPGTVAFTPQLDGVTLVTTPATRTLVLTGDSATAQIGASDLTVTTDNAVADDVATNQVRAVVTDAGGRPVSGVAVSFSTVLPAHITVSTGVTDINGVATASVASPKAGPVTVTASVNGDSRNVTTVFVASTITATITYANMVINPDGAVANNTATNGVQVTVTDATGNVVPNMPVIFSVCAGATITPVTVTSDPLGRASATVTSTKSGGCVAGAKVNGYTQTRAMRFVADTATAGFDSLMSRFDTVRSGKLANGSDTDAVEAIITDANGNPVEGVTVSFSAGNGATVLTVSAVTDADGRAATDITSLTAGISTVTASVTSSTGHISTRTTEVVFMAGMPVTGNSTLTAGTASIIANNGGTGGTSVLTLVLKDTNNNPVSGKTVTFPVTGTASAGITGLTGGALAATETAPGSGVYTATLQGITAGTATVSPAVGGAAFSATPGTVNVTLVADPSTAAVSTLSGTTTPALANNTDTQTLTTTVKDAEGNVVPGATVNFTVTTGIATLSSATATTNASGVATVTVKDTTAETATIAAKVGTNAADTGKTADVTFGLYPVVSSIAPGVNNSPADGVTQNTLIVQVSDLAGNAIKNMPVTLNFAGTDLKTGPATLKYGATGITAASTAQAVTTDSSGQVVLTATNVTAESVSVSAKVSTSTQAAQTAASAFVAYPVLTPANLTITSDTAPADGVTTNAVQAKVTDLKGNPLSGKTVTFTVTSPSGQAAGTSTLTPVTDASGIATLTLTDRTMETAAVKATVGTAVPTNQVQTVTPVFKLFATLTMTVSNNNCAVACTVTFNVTALNANGGPVAGLVVGTYDGGGYGTGGAKGTTSGAGTVTLTRTYTAATTNNMTYGYANIADNPVMSARNTEYATSQTPVTTVNPVSITNITTPANPYTFTTGSGFPQTGFNGAYFKVNLSDSNPTAYTWAVDGVNGGTSYTTVDTNGQVTLKAAKSGMQTVQVKNTATGTVLASFPFTLKGWFTGFGIPDMLSSAAVTYCGSGTSLPSRAELGGSTSGISGTSGSRGDIGGMWTEWGNSSKYTGITKYASAWTRDLADPGNYWYVSHDNNGLTNRGSSPSLDKRSVLCRQGL